MIGSVNPAKGEAPGTRNVEFLKRLVKQAPLLNLENHRLVIAKREGLVGCCVFRCGR